MGSSRAGAMDAEAAAGTAFEAGGEICQSCGACCAYSREWPRFSLETDAELDLIPAALIDPSLAGMRCVGDRCIALAGEVGRATRCTVHSIRPQVCRSCMPGDDACRMARERFKLYELPRFTAISI